MKKVSKAKNYIDWDKYFMGVAKLSAMRSKDPNTTVGSCIVDPIKKTLLGVGYNGLARGMKDDEINWARDEKTGKYPYIIHAEINAILNSHSNLEDAILYTTEFPCAGCTKVIIQCGIKTIVYASDKYKNSPDTQTAKKMFSKCGVNIREYKFQKMEIA